MLAVRSWKHQGGCLGLCLPCVHISLHPVGPDCDARSWRELAPMLAYNDEPYKRSRLAKAMCTKRGQSLQLDICKKKTQNNKLTYVTRKETGMVGYQWYISSMLKTKHRLSSRPTLASRVSVIVSSLATLASNIRFSLITSRCSSRNKTSNKSTKYKLTKKNKRGGI